MSETLMDLGPVHQTRVRDASKKSARYIGTDNQLLLDVEEEASVRPESVTQQYSRAEGRNAYHQHVLSVGCYQ
jgi:hypothetical protein